MAASSSSGEDFDPNKASKGMDKYSRQVGAYGVGVMKFLRALKVLVVGLKGVGIEAAKNLVLTGCKAVHLHDDGNAEVADLGTNFFLREAHVGKPRAASLKDAVQELNEDVEVEAVSGDVSAILNNYGAVIVTDNSIPLATLTAWNEQARSNNIVFTLALTSGPLGLIFADFGDKHVCSDFDGEPHKYIAIQNIVFNEDKKYELFLDDPHELDDGSHIQVEDVLGIPEFDKKVFVLRRFYTKEGKLVPDRLILDSVVGAAEPVNFASWGTYEKGGYIREVKAETEINHQPLTAALLNGNVLFPDQMKSFDGAPQRAILNQVALWSFIAANGHLPRLHNAEDAASVATFAKEAHAAHTAANAANVADLVPEETAKVALYARVEISGMCAFLGGVVAQEVIKKSSKWNPITQFLAHEVYDLVDAAPPADGAVQGSRYDNHYALFGKAFQESLMNDKWFLVGCGALGCEYMKAFALMGVSCGPEGLLNATDMDTIEVSNLARQFLFRREHVGKQKSVCASLAAKLMNPSMQIKTYTDMVAPKTEHVFNENFWESLTGVVNALDNVQARLYVDSRCVLFKRPLLESGTLGTKANTEVIIPYKTSSYGENHVEVKQKQVPQCTFKNFPYLIEHTIGWAGKAGEFATLFVQPAEDLKTAIEDLDQFWRNLARLNTASKKLERLKPVTDLLPHIAAPTFETCVDLAFKRLLSQYRDRILDLTHFCPIDMMKTDRDSGKSVPFWSAPKRFPHPIVWDPANPANDLVEYVYNTANLYAYLLHLEPKRDLTENREEFKSYLVGLNLVPPTWNPPTDKSALGEVEEENADKEKEGPKEDEVARDNALLEELTARINSYDWASIRAKNEQFKAAKEDDIFIRPAEFEKDDDTNFHIDFVTSASNLRATNYGIPNADRHKTKMTAGNIIPAIATTTAMITGLNSIEFLKLKKGLPVDKIHNSNVNLGTSSFQLFEPSPPNKAVAQYDEIEMETIEPVPAGFTIWDSIVINEGDLTLQAFLDRFPQIHHGVVVTGILGPLQDQKKDGENQRTQLIYSNFGMFAERVSGYLSKTISEIWQIEYGALPPSSFLPLSVSAELNDVPVKIPNPVIFKYK